MSFMALANTGGAGEQTVDLVKRYFDYPIDSWGHHLPVAAFSHAAFDHNVSCGDHGPTCPFNASFMSAQPCTTHGKKVA